MREFEIVYKLSERDINIQKQLQHNNIQNTRYIELIQDILSYIRNKYDRNFGIFKKTRSERFNYNF